MPSPKEAKNKIWSFATQEHWGIKTSSSSNSIQPGKWLLPTFRIGEWLLEAPAIYRVPKLEGDFLAPISPGSQPLIELQK
jgi:hypothetical protein